MVYYVSLKRKYPIEKRASFQEIIISFKESLPALFTIIIILGGMFSGIVTPIEAAILGVAYSIFLGFVVYREMSLKDLIESIKQAT